MISPVEVRRIIAEWRLRVQRVKDILQPVTWSEKEWRQFSQGLALMVREHGTSWIIDPNVYWDLRWKLQDGGELVCQIEHVPGEKTSLVVAQNGGFAVEAGSYTWLWAEFDMEGQFSRDPYWVDGTWKDALTALLLPLDRQSSYMLAGRTDTPDSLLLQNGARPNDGQFALTLGTDQRSEESGKEEEATLVEAATPEDVPSTERMEPAPMAEVAVESRAEAVASAEPVSDPLPESDSIPEGELKSVEISDATPVASPSGTAAVREIQMILPSPSFASARLRRRRAHIRFFRSLRPVQPRSYYRDEKNSPSDSSLSSH